jgi:hypothetical protein
MITSSLLIPDDDKPRSNAARRGITPRWTFRNFGKKRDKRLKDPDILMTGISSPRGRRTA